MQCKTAIESVAFDAETTTAIRVPKGTTYQLATQLVAYYEPP
jgi:hypothetical protein